MAYFSGDLNFPWGKLKKKKSVLQSEVGHRCEVTGLEPFPLGSPLLRFLEGFAGGNTAKSQKAESHQP